MNFIQEIAKQSGLFQNMTEEHKTAVNRIHDDITAYINSKQVKSILDIIEYMCIAEKHKFDDLFSILDAMYEVRVQNMHIKYKA